MSSVPVSSVPASPLKRKHEEIDESSHAASLPSPAPGSHPPRSPNLKATLGSLIHSMEEYTRRLHFDVSLAKQAMEFLHYFLVSGSGGVCHERVHEDTAENHQLWMGCALWISAAHRVHSLKESGLSESDSLCPIPSLTAILTLLAIPLPAFTRHLNHFISHLRIGSSSVLLHSAPAGSGSLPVPAPGPSSASLSPSLASSLSSPSFTTRVQEFEKFLLCCIGVYLKFEKIFLRLFIDSGVLENWTKTVENGKVLKKRKVTAMEGGNKKKANKKESGSGNNGSSSENAPTDASSPSESDPAASTTSPVLRGSCPPSPGASSVSSAPSTPALQAQVSRDLTGLSKSNFYGFLWLLYLTAKNEFQLFGQDAEMYSMYLTLLSVLKLALQAISPGKSDQEILDLISTAGGRDGERPDADLAAALKAMESERFAIFMDEMIEKQVLTAKASRISTERHTDNLNVTETLTPQLIQRYSVFTAENLLSNAVQLGNYLDGQTLAALDPLYWIDERIFLLEPIKKGLGVLVVQGAGITSELNEEFKTRAARRLFTEKLEDTDSPARSVATSSVASTAIASAALRAFAIPPSPQQLRTPHKAHAHSHLSSELAFSPVLRSQVYPAAPVPPTPVSRMMESVAWLMNRFREAKPEPSATLRAIFAQLSVDPAVDPLSRLVSLVDSLSREVQFSTSISSANASAPENQNQSSTTADEGKSNANVTAVEFCPRRALALKIYYRVLESILLSERSRLEKSGPQSILSWALSRSFHSSLLALAFELVIHAYKVDSLSFPRILSAFKLSAWDLIKLIESFIRHCPGLPNMLKAHLRDIEYEILECRAWKAGEPLMQLLKQPKYQEAIAQGMKPSVVASQPRPQALHTIQSTPDRRVDDHSSISSANSYSNGISVPVSSVPNADATTSALLLFFRKLFALAAERILFLCGEGQLNVSQELEEGVWWLVRHILVRKPELLYQRHLDTILLSSIYTILVKVAKQTLDFKRIITVYLGRWENHSSAVVREVFNREGEQPVSIINFYNEQFIPAIKGYALDVIKPRLAELQAASASHRSPLGRIRAGSHLAAHAPSDSSPMPRRQLGSPRLVSAGGGSIYLSPLRAPNSPATTAPLSTSQAANPNTMTPRTKSLFAFGESPRQALASMNRLLNPTASIPEGSESSESSKKQGYSKKLF